MEVAESEEYDEEDLDIQQVEPPTISMQAALSHLDDLYTFSFSQSDDNMREKVVELMVEDVGEVEKLEKLKSKKTMQGIRVLRVTSYSFTRSLIFCVV